MNRRETSEIRELTSAELEEVAGGIRPAAQPVPVPYPNVVVTQSWWGTDEAAGQRG
jgi:hypothetical protein